MTKRMLGVLVTDSLISMVFDGKAVSVSSDSLNYSELKKEILSGSQDEEKIAGLINPISLIKQRITEAGHQFSVDDADKIFVNGHRLNHVLENKLIHDLNKGYPVKSFANFVLNLLENPSSTSVEELYLFIEKANLPLTEDGCFLAYKRVNKDYTDIFSGNFDNSVGSVLEMPRNQVDDRRHNICSYGFHFCSFEYLKHFSGARTMVVKINPRDVVSIPSDYNNTKGRCCRYEVIAEIDDDRLSSEYLEGKYGEDFDSEDEEMITCESCGGEFSDCEIEDDLCVDCHSEHLCECGEYKDSRDDEFCIDCEEDQEDDDF